eukprot:SAG11_NODE_2901_length_2849_cov_4.048727_1_plen_169_part_00
MSVPDASRHAEATKLVEALLADVAGSSIKSKATTKKMVNYFIFLSPNHQRRRRWSTTTTTTNFVVSVPDASRHAEATKLVEALLADFAGSNIKSKATTKKMVNYFSYGQQWLTYHDSPEYMSWTQLALEAASANVGGGAVPVQVVDGAAEMMVQLPANAVGVVLKGWA